MSDRRLVLVTGASRGIGDGIAKYLAKKNFQVLGTSTSQKGANAISESLAFADGCGLVLNVNDDLNELTNFYHEIKEKFGRFPDILVNNAGITDDGLLLRMSEDQWGAVLSTNLSSVFKLSKVAMKPMLKQKWGRIITIGSVVGTKGNPGQANYAAAKAGLVGFSKSLAMEVAKKGVTVNVVSPGFIETDMTAALDDKQMQAILDNVPMSRMGHVNEIGSLVGFIAGEDSGYITGHNFHINGGLFMA